MSKDRPIAEQNWERDRQREQERLAEERTALARRQTSTLTAIESTLTDYGDRQYSAQYPVTVDIDTSGLSEYVDAVSEHMEDVGSALDAVGDVLEIGMSALTDGIAQNEELLRSIDDYASYLPDIDRSLETSNALLAGIGAGVGLATYQLDHIHGTLEQGFDDIHGTLEQGLDDLHEELEIIDGTLERGFESVTEGLEDVVTAVYDGAHRVADAVFDGAHYIATTIAEETAITHRHLLSLEISLEQSTRISQLQHLSLLEHLSRLHDMGVVVHRQESAAIQTTMRELAAHGRSIEAEELYGFALVDRAAGNQPAAVRNLHKALKKRSAFAEAWFLLGMLAFENGGITAARDAFSLAMRYAETLELPIVEEQALNALLMLEHLIGNEQAWRALLLKKYEKGFKMDRKELFEVLRTWLQQCRNPEDLSHAQQEVLKEELPRMVRERVHCGFIVATQDEFALVRPHLGRVETFGSWAYVFYDLRVIVLRTLCAHYAWRCVTCGRTFGDEVKGQLLTLSRNILTLIDSAVEDFRHGLPVDNVPLYRYLMQRRDTWLDLVLCDLCDTEPNIKDAYIVCRHLWSHKPTHRISDELQQLMDLMPHSA